MAAFGSVVEHIGRVRGLPAQTMTLNRRLCGFHLNELQVQLLNGYSLVLDTWPVGADNGTYRTKDGRYVQMIGLFPHMVNPLLVHLQCANTPQAIQAAVEKHTAQLLEDDVADGLNLALGMVRTPQEWLAHPQGAATGKLPLVDIEQQGRPRTAWSATLSIGRSKAYGWSTSPTWLPVPPPGWRWPSRARMSLRCIRPTATG